MKYNKQYHFFFCCSTIQYNKNVFLSIFLEYFLIFIGQEILSESFFPMFIENIAQEPKLD